MCCPIYAARHACATGQLCDLGFFLGLEVKVSRERWEGYTGLYIKCGLDFRVWGVLFRALACVSV